MTLFGAILKKINSKESNKKRFESPPPKLNKNISIKKRKKRPFKYGHIKAVVDTSPPRYDAARLFRLLPEWRRCTHEIYMDNAKLLMAIRSSYLNGGKVDSHWTQKLYPTRQSYERRMNSYKDIMRENSEIYKRIKITGPRVVTTECLQREWERTKREMIQIALTKFTLFPTTPVDIMEDLAFKPTEGVKRPRVYLRVGAVGSLCIELFPDVSPQTCQLFLQLLRGDGLGHGYVGTRFFRKVPGLYWSGGDVIHDAGVGCYAQRGQLVPIGAENYHFSHSMPGLLSMQVTKDDEMCGIFNITFKPLPQFDLRNVVFGRIIRPCQTYDAIQTLSGRSHPVIKIESAKLKVKDHWVYGTRNTQIRSIERKHVPRTINK